MGLLGARYTLYLLTVIILEAILKNIKFRTKHGECAIASQRLTENRSPVKRVVLALNQIATEIVQRSPAEVKDLRNDHNCNGFLDMCVQATVTQNFCFVLASAKHGEIPMIELHRILRRFSTEQHCFHHTGTV